MTGKHTEQVLDFIGDLAMAGAQRLGATTSPTGLALLAVSSLLKAAALAMRDGGKSVDEILTGIRMPRKLDTSWRDEIDRQIKGE